METRAILFLSSAYLAGLIGIGLPIHPDFVLLTPFNLLLSTAFVWWFHPLKSQKFYIFASIAALTGFLVEMIGVKTGLIFGNYQYDYALGPKIWDTPPMIGVSWFLTTYCAACTVEYCAKRAPILTKALLAAALMTALDWLIEPIAMTQRFWSWDQDTVPLQNYWGWFVIGFCLQYLCFYWQIAARNVIALSIFIFQVLFFLGLQWMT